MATADIHTACTIFRELAAGSISPDWRSKWQAACEVAWANLSEDVPPECVDLWARLLQDHDRFALARLVVPELRSTHPLPNSQYQRRILDDTVDLRKAFSNTEQRTQSYFDSPAYVEEKRILQEAELHRARVLLHRSEAFGHSVTEEEIARWLAEAPSGSGGVQGHTATQ
ncbi:hypothetical protein KC331_g227 [Hortaea werneckii]|nr:hypothetical protein KC331_g227 [Hortaea werneckii]KAI7722707.1 hypothetical protein KC353_g264 [Hortaea werneckii]